MNWLWNRTFEAVYKSTFNFLTLGESEKTEQSRVGLRTYKINLAES